MKPRLLSLFLLVALLAAGALFAGALAAQPGARTPEGAPGTMTHQGYLVDRGQPITGTVGLRFGLYSASGGGTALWQETHNSVPVTDGYYTVLLGSSTPLDAGLFSSTTRYLQVSVDTGGGFVDLPRQPVTSVPYAFQAAAADTAASADTALQADHATTADQATNADNATTADSAPWSGLTGVPAGFADGVDDVGGGVAYEHF
ncbi:MAG: hypothetical protein KC425_15475, partial [Anaerolineales bacterium]|nr:hypothetical protein [Anaerolineales bacterium]